MANYVKKDLAFVKVCRVCLCQDRTFVSLVESGFEELFSLLVGCKVSEDPSTGWLCYRCAHRMKRVSTLRKVCVKADEVLRECYFNYAGNFKGAVDFLNYQRRQGWLQSLDTELSVSNMLCVDVKTEDCDSHSSVEVVSYVDGFDRQRNVCDGNVSVVYRPEREPHPVSFEITNMEAIEKTETLAEADIERKGPKLRKKKQTVKKSLAHISKKLRNQKFKKPCKKDPSDFGLPKGCGNSDADQIVDNSEDCSRGPSPSCDNEFNPMMLCMTGGFSNVAVNGVKQCTDFFDVYGDLNPRMIVSEILKTREQIEEDRDMRRSDPAYISSPYKCEPCIMGFNFRNTLDVHLKRHDPERGGEVCDVCGQRFNKEDSLKNHKHRLHRLRVRCALCGLRLSDMQRAREHARKHAGQTYECDKCQATFKSHGGLKSHVQKKHDTKNFSCQFCPVLFLTTESLEKHQSICEKKSQEKLTCPDCGEMFRNSYAMKTHREKYHSTLKHYCVECDKYFATDAILQNHLTNSKMHMDINTLKYGCERCTLRFPSEHQLRVHVENKHERVARYTCATCGARYSTRYGLNVHRRKAHEGYVPPKKYPCQLCDKSFTQRSLATNHMRTHTGERPFACTQCEWKFTQKNALVTHERLVHLKLKRNLKKKKNDEEIVTNQIPCSSTSSI